MGTRMIGVSIAVPEPHGSLLQERRAGFGDPAARAIPSHITLLPPTKVAASALPAFREHLDAVAAAWVPFRLRLAGTGTFRPLSPVVYIQLAEGVRDCSELQERVRSGPVRRDLDFPYHPHVTVAHGIAEEAMDRAQRELAGFSACWTVTGFSLYEQGDDGVWRTTGDYPFGQGAPAVPHQARRGEPADRGTRTARHT
ncbi:2'-5' RNA ligase family protein [Streptomyces sp. RB6PN25]|uniref:2'-5' RNA ligase family protein n=1 Tax=Streptomyces humicola TaxID=2953240 RepID=A0ABT1PY05_9ACTN|nr:2'-5' RNA ligase family protein [Streptomyces humicola]MCQ4082547.1 2'-5' RNA ligase family protein [Streptomyces humicola]